MRTPTLTHSSSGFRPPAAALVLMGGISSQCGAALATKLIAQVGPAGTLTMRLVFAAAALVAAAHPRRQELRRLLHPANRSDLAVVCAFGLALAGMNFSFYESIERIPLGVAVTVEFVGPLTIALTGSRRWADGVWAILAATGTLLLAAGSLFGTLRHLDIAGVGFAALAGSFWAAYILLNKETGKRIEGTTGLAVAMTIAAVVVTPVGIVRTGAALLRPAVLGVGAAVALLSSAIPYSFELVALRRATPRAFGILLSISPAVAALAGFAILGQRLSALEIGALLLVVAANLGSSWLGTPAAPAAPAALGVTAPAAPAALGVTAPAAPAALGVTRTTRRREPVRDTT
jgi:inner membrane transporter RhtA